MAEVNVQLDGLVIYSMGLSQEQIDSLNRINADRTSGGWLLALVSTRDYYKSRGRDTPYIAPDRVRRFFEVMERDLNGLNPEERFKLVEYVNSSFKSPEPITEMSIRDVITSSLELTAKSRIDVLLDAGTIATMYPVFQEMCELREDRILGADAPEYRKRITAAKELAKHKLARMAPPG
jgi:hypothetical protein